MRRDISLFVDMTANSLVSAGVNPAVLGDLLVWASMASDKQLGELDAVLAGRYGMANLLDVDCICTGCAMPAPGPAGSLSACCGCPVMELD